MCACMTCIQYFLLVQEHVMAVTVRLSCLCTCMTGSCQYHTTMSSLYCTMQLAYEIQTNCGLAAAIKTPAAQTLSCIRVCAELCGWCISFPFSPLSCGVHFFIDLVITCCCCCCFCRRAVLSTYLLICDRVGFCCLPCSVCYFAVV